MAVYPGQMALFWKIIWYCQSTVAGWNYTERHKGQVYDRLAKHQNGHRAFIIIGIIVVDIVVFLRALSIMKAFESVEIGWLSKNGHLCPPVLFDLLLFVMVILHDWKDYQYPIMMTTEHLTTCILRWWNICSVIKSEQITLIWKKKAQPYGVMSFDNLM